jgi:hypothetical protein
MMVCVSRKIRFYLPGGVAVLLEPGNATELPEASARELIRKAQEFVTIVPESRDWRDCSHDPRAPLQPDWFIAFHHDGHVRGGAEDGDLGRVVKVVLRAGEWYCFTGARKIIPARRVKSVQAVSPHAAWLTKEHGLDGRGDDEPTARARLLDLEPDQRQQIIDQFQLDKQMYAALATGDWTDVLWAGFWRTNLLVSLQATDTVSMTANETIGQCRCLFVHDGVNPSPDLSRRRTTITIRTATGHRQVGAWIVGKNALTVHKSIARTGITVGHLASGCTVLSNIRSRDDAFALASRLLELPCDWSHPTTPIPNSMRETIFALLRETPRYQSRKSRSPA